MTLLPGFFSYFLHSGMRMKPQQGRAMGSTSLPTRAFILLVSIAALAMQDAVAYSSNADALSGMTLRDIATITSTNSCGGCHTTGFGAISVAIGTGPTSLTIGTSQTYTVSVSGATNGDRLVALIAASDSPTPLAPVSSALTAGTTLAASRQLAAASSSGTLAVVAGGAASYSFTYAMPAGAAPGSLHTLSATARTGQGSSGGGWNTATNFTIKAIGNQTITFGAAPTVNVGTTGTVSATGGASGNAVTFTSSTTSVCTVSGTNGSTVTGVTPGTCTIAANQAGNTNYNAATQVTQNITVGKGSQTIAFGAAPTVNVGTTGTVSATGGASGNAVTFTSSTTSVCTVSGTNGSTVTGVTPGTCTIAANQAGNTNYNAATQVTQNITVGKGSQTIAFGAAPTVNVGTTGTVSATGGASGNAVTFTSSTTSVCTVSGTNGSIVTGVTPGTCTIAANQAGNTNYNAATQVTQNITVGKGTQTIAFGAAPTVNVGTTGTVSATGGASGNAVTFTSSTTSVCTVSGTNGSIVTGVTPGTCTIAANQAGNTNYNAATQVTQNITVGKGTQTIAFGAAPTVNVGTTGTVSATGGASGNAVTFTSSTTSVCTVSGTNGSTVTGVTPGTCTIAANQAGNTNYNAATQVTQNITVGKGTQTIVFGAAPTVAVGGTGTVSATGGASGNPVTFSSTTTSVCSIAGTTVSGLTAGTCIIAANQAGNANYNAAPQVTQSIGVGKDSQTIVFGAAPTIVVGGTGTVSATGGASGNPVTFTSTTTSVCTVSGTNGSTVTGIIAGTCTIAADQAGNANYSPATQVTQNITVGKGSQTITFGAAPTVVAGGTGTVSATGGASGNPVTFTSTTTSVCTVSGTNGSTVTGVAPGACTIAADQAGNANYDAAPQVTQNFSIAPAPPTVSGPSATGSGTITASFTGGGDTCTFGTAQFIAVTGNPSSPPAGSAPSGVSFPHGLFDFTTTGCTPGSTITMTIVYPSALPAGTQYYKYGPQPGPLPAAWYVLPATIVGNTIKFTITDGQLGDDDLTANGTIVDQGGPGSSGTGSGGGGTATVTPVPTLSQWAMILLSMLLAVIAMRNLARRR